MDFVESLKKATMGKGSSLGPPHYIRSPLAGCVDGEKIRRAVQRCKWTDDMASVVIDETVIDLAFTGKIVVIGGRVIDSALCQLISTDHHLYSVNQGKNPSIRSMFDG